MSNFVSYQAVGTVYARDKNGRFLGIKEIIHVSGMVRAGKDMLGHIFRQQADLLPCDTVSVSTYNI